MWVHYYIHSLHITLHGMGTDMLLSTSHTLVPIPTGAATGVMTGGYCRTLSASLQQGGARKEFTDFSLVTLFVCLIFV